MPTGKEEQPLGEATRARFCQLWNSQGLGRMLQPAALLLGGLTFFFSATSENCLTSVLFVRLSVSFLFISCTIACSISCCWSFRRILGVPCILLLASWRKVGHSSGSDSAACAPGTSSSPAAGLAQPLPGKYLTLKLP